MKQTLNQLHEQAMRLATEAYDAEGDEAIDAWWIRVDEWADASGEKLLAYRIVRERLLAEMAYLKEQAAQVNKAAGQRARQVESIEERVKGFLATHRELTGADKVTLSDGSWARLVERVTPVVVVDDLDELPAEYKRTTVAPDKRALAAAMKGGAEVPGAHLGESEATFVMWPRR